MKLKIFKFFKKNYFFLLYVLLFFHRAGHKGCNNKRKDKDVIGRACGNLTILCVSDRSNPPWTSVIIAHNTKASVLSTGHFYPSNTSATSLIRVSQTDKKFVHTTLNELFSHPRQNVFS